MSLESKIEEIKKRLAEFWQRTNTASIKKCNFLFPVLPGNAEAQVI